jgi:hypothetical protein
LSIRNFGESPEKAEGEADSEKAFNGKTCVAATPIPTAAKN